MSDSIRDQLLGLGFKPAPKPPSRPQAPQPGARRNETRGQDRGKPDARPQHRGAQGRPGKPGTAGRPGGAGQRTRAAEMDLGKAYALRAQREKDERIAAEAARQEEARLRREARAKLGDYLKDKALNDKDADIARHFPYGGKIKRIYVNAEQLRALNAGELGVVQLDGRYILVTTEVLAEAEGIFPACVALRVDPDAPASDDPYSDPQYQVPDDLVW
ncbi:DUF2058 domain-containing protein [Lysobacter humi (ex Lee et al. 2017)]